MPANISKYLIERTQYHANMTDANNLGRLTQQGPTKLFGHITKIFSAQNYYCNNPIGSILSENAGATITIGGTEWEWELQGNDTKPLVVLEDIEPGNTTKGKYGNSFKIKLDENWFKVTDLITPGTSSIKYNCLIVDGPVAHGDGFVYTLKLVDADSTKTVPAKLFEAGTTWDKSFSPSGEAAEKGGSTQFSTPIAMRNKLSKFRKQYRITDYASTEVLQVAIPDKDGKPVKTWMRYADAAFMMQWQQELEIARWYSRSGTVLQDNGNPYQIGPGLQEQLEDSTQEIYNTLSTGLIDSFLMDMFYGRVAPGSNGRNVVGFSGEYGMAAFHEAISNLAQKRGLIQNIEVFTDKVKSDYNQNAYSYGMQYVKYNLTNGGSLQLIHNPMYDNRKLHTEVDPITGVPIESMRITFLDLNADNGESNIKLIKKQGGDFLSYVCGNYGPDGPANRNSNPAHSGDYYEMHIGAHEGINITDVTKCGELIYSPN